MNIIDYVTLNGKSREQVIFLFLAELLLIVINTVQLWHYILLLISIVCDQSLLRAIFFIKLKDYLVAERILDLLMGIQWVINVFVLIKVLKLLGGYLVPFFDLLLNCLIWRFIGRLTIFFKWGGVSIDIKDISKCRSNLFLTFLKYIRRISFLFSL